MSRRIWLLVEWVDERRRNIFPTYEVINIDRLAYNEADLNPGRQILISYNRENPPRRAQILRLSESKRYLEEQKEILERQDKKMNNVFQLCMRTIKEMKSEAMSMISPETSSRSVSSQNAVIHVTANREDSASESEDEANNDIKRLAQLNKTVKYNQYNGVEINRHYRPSYCPIDNQRRRSIVSSTPIPGSNAPDTIKLCFDQGSQTDNSLIQPKIKKIEDMESELKSLYQRFQSVVSKMNTLTHSVNSYETERNEADISFEPTVSESWAEQNNIQYNETLRAVDQHVNNLEPERVESNASNASNIKTEGENNGNALRVRRMSAQTTNNIEHIATEESDMVSLGSSNAMVPARLLNEMDWNSHTSVTRALLQAIFPRKVLATHSLTGKQSPAFTNKPPKKILDPVIVEDIVKTVSTRCGVPKNLVRNSITIKCTDEAKLYRNRQYRHARQMSNQNEENIQPSTPSSDELSAINN